jgi:serine/threonine protein kinase
VHKSEHELPNQAQTVRNPSPDDPWIGRRLKKYEIVGHIGKGGMGVVYLAEDTVLQRAVAIKMIAGSPTDEPRGLDRFLREARSAARLQHANVVAIYDVDEDQGTHYLVMEFVPGPSAEQIGARDGPLPWKQAVQIVADACRGLIAAHASGLIHRDIKPANLLVSATGEVKLGDFGLAKAVADDGVSVTQQHVRGTPLYMSPEQTRNEDLDERSDLYSLGATLYALLAGEPPYGGKDWFATMYAHSTAPIPDPRRKNADVPEAVVKIIQRAMAKKRSDRYADAEAMLEALDAVLGPKREDLRPLAEDFEVPRVPTTASSIPDVRKPTQSRRWLVVSVCIVGFFLLTGIGIACAGAAGWLWFHRTPAQPALTAEEFKKNLIASNPGFDGKITLQEREGRIVKVAFAADHITDVKPVGELADLEDLELFVNVGKESRLTELAPLGRLTKLTRVRISGVPAEDVAFLRQLRSVTHADLGGTRVKDLAPLRDLPLTELRLGAAPIVDLKGLHDAPIETLYLDYCYRLKSLDGLPTKRLRWLSLASTDVADLAPMKEARNLEFIDLHWASVTRSQRDQTPPRSLRPSDMAILEGLPKLQTIVGEFTPDEVARLQEKLPARPEVKTIPRGK